MIVYKFVIFWGAFIFTCVAVGIMLSPVIVFSMKCAWFEAAEREDLVTLKLLPFSWGKRFINVVDTQGNTALHRAAQNGASKSVSFLVKKGIKKGVPNIAGNTAMDLAQNAGHTVLASYLAPRKRKKRVTRARLANKRDR